MRYIGKPTKSVKKVHHQDLPSDYAARRDVLDEAPLLDETFDTTTTPAKITVPMWQHQLTSLAALHSAESHRTTGSGRKLCSSPALVYSDAIGTGKTLVILALAASKKTPSPVLPIPVFFNSISLEARAVGDGGARPRVLLPTVVFVGASVIMQWKAEIETKTSLTYMIVANKTGFERLAEAVDDGSINAIDIVVVKCGHVSGVVAKEKIPSDRVIRTTFEVVFSISAGSQWSRVIYDDFDTINIPSWTVTLMANSIILVSSTSKTTYRHGGTLKSLWHGLPAVVCASSLEKFKVGCCKHFIERSQKVPAVKFYEYVYVNPYDAFIGMIGVMGGDVADEIVEMLNGDAIGTAAEKMGIKAASVTDVFAKILGKRWDDYRTAQQTVEFIDSYLDHLDDLADEIDPDVEIKEHSEESLLAAKKKLKRRKRPTIGVTAGLQNTAEDALDEVTADRDNHGKAISRAKDNIREGACQVCKIPFDDPLLAGSSVIINRCCGIILCEICGIKGNRIGRGYRGASIAGSCANCKAKINATEDIVFVDQNIKLDDLVNSYGVDAEVTPEPVVEVEDAPKEPPKPNPKHIALLQIIRGEVPEARRDYPLVMKNLLDGTTETPYGGAGQIIVFASYNETLASAIESMTAAGITSRRLQGTSKIRDDIVKEFAAGVFRVLCISAQDTCAGLNLQFATDLVFMHDIVDHNVVEQVVGRIHRIDRKIGSAHVHFLRYENESRAVATRARVAGWHVGR